MNKILAISALALLASACGKGELDPASLTSNPFDPDYNGPEVFVYDTTFTRNVSIPGGVVQYQVIGFHVKSELLPSSASYSVAVEETATGIADVIDPQPPNSNRFEYLKINPVVGAPVCLRLSLRNNQSNARPEVICATL
ncbi:MAG TPA: hypothetical protein PKY96_09140 [Flavobacteriales bacterium]|nr:hypothetical protein [Flavobacteriales bacterium]